MKKLLLIFSLSLLTNISISQTIPEGGYHAPLGIPLVLSSNFGELRPNHFHMGIDFKTNNKTGYNLYSIADGYVSRIKVSPYGYGKVVYIDHPNGITSVYAHCSEFKGKVDSIVRATQEAEQNFAVEIFPKKGEIPLKKGERFALSGNTGSSTAPHVHFEIRDTKTEAALNPLVFGFDIADSKAPLIRGVKAYAITKEGYRYPDIEKQQTTQRVKTGLYAISSDMFVLSSDFCTKSGGIGFAFDVIDQLDGAPNHCGLYGSYLIVDGDTIFGQKINRVPFESTRYVNSHKDYEAYAYLRKKYHKSFKTDENDLPIYLTEGNGVIHVKPGDKKQVRFVAFDAKGNQSEIQFQLVVQQGSINTKDSIATDLTFLQPSQSMMVSNDNREIEFGLATVYEPMKINEEEIDTHIGEANTPVHNAYRIKIKAKKEPTGKEYIEIRTAKNRIKTIKAAYENGWFYGDSKYFGTYQLKEDRNAPTLTALNITKSTTIISKDKMMWRVSEKETNLADYDIFIDGKWYVLEYETKGSLLIFDVPESFEGTKEILVRVSDDHGNTNEWQKEVTFR